MEAARVARSFREAGSDAETACYDFASHPLAGLCPGSAALNALTRVVDDALVRLPAIKAWSNAFDLLARAPA